MEKNAILTRTCKCLEMSLYSILAKSKFNLNLHFISSESLYCLPFWRDYKADKLGEKNGTRLLLFRISIDIILLIKIGSMLLG